VATRRRPPADEDPGTADSTPSGRSPATPFIEVHPDAPTVVPPRDEEQALQFWSLPAPTIPPAPRSPGLPDPVQSTLAPSAPSNSSLPIHAEFEDADELRKLRDTIAEQLVQMPLEQLHFCRHELEALGEVLALGWRGLLREALEWATTAHLRGGKPDRDARAASGPPKPAPVGVDVVARVRQNAWWLGINVPGTLRAELVDAVLRRLIEAQRSAASQPPRPLDSKAAVRWVERAMLEARATDAPATPTQPPRGGQKR
jgi:hypothetical protein